MFAQWDVWTVFWDHRDANAETAGKARPAVLFTDDDHIGEGTDLLFMKFSTRRYEGVPDIRLDRADGSEFACTGLVISPSYLHFTAVQKIPRGQLIKRIGHLGEATVELLVDKIEELKRRHRRQT